VLDVAFGAGRDTLYFLEQGLEVEGIELSQAFIKALTSKTDIPLYKMDMRQLEFDSCTFDGIWCCSAFLHLPRLDALKTLKGFARILKPHGILYLDVKEGEGEKWKMEQDGNVSNVFRYFTYYHLDEISQLLRNAGFEILLNKTQDHIKPNKAPWLNIIGRKLT
jgi:ubiquinone/menaquinone biosynthesis C-methylase UbiE